MKTKGISQTARNLHSALVQRGLKAEIEKWDGHKHIDIAIVKAKLNIEVDGLRHFTDPVQIETDFKRAWHSEEKGYDTIHIPNLVLEHHLDEVADALVKVALERLTL